MARQDVGSAGPLTADDRRGPRRRRRVGRPRTPKVPACGSRAARVRLAGGLRRGQPWCGDDCGRRIGDGGLGLPPHATRAVGIPAIVPRGDVDLVGDVDQHARQRLERVHSLGARRRAVRLVRPKGHDLRGAVVRESLQRDRIAGAVPGEPRGEGAVEHPAGEELLSHLRDNGPPRAATGRTRA